jgi:hypothetical protein
MANLTEVPKSELVQRFQRMQTTLKNARKEGEEIASRAMTATTGLAGGALCGAMRGWDDEPMTVPGTDIPADAAVAAVAILAGVTGVAGKASDSIVSFGTGVGAAAIAFHVKDAVQNRDK